MCLSHSLRVLSENSLKFNHNAPVGLFKTNSQRTHQVYSWVHCGWILGNFLKELSMSGSGTLRAHFDQIMKELSEFFQTVAHRFFDGFFDGFIQNVLAMCSLIPLRSNWLVHWEAIDNLPSECTKPVPCWDILNNVLKGPVYLLCMYYPGT